MAVVMLSFGSMLFGCEVGTQSSDTRKVDTLQSISHPTGNTIRMQADTVTMWVGEIVPVTVDTPGAMQTDSVCTITMGQPMLQTTDYKPPIVMGRPLRPLLQPNTKKPATDTSR